MTHKETPVQVMEAYGIPLDVETVCRVRLVELCEQILQTGGPCGGNEVFMAGASHRLAALALYYLGHGTMEIDVST